MRWLITGGCGFIGRNLISNLFRSDAEHQITVFDNLSANDINDMKVVPEIAAAHVASLSDPRWRREKGHVDVVVGDVTDAENARRVSEGADVLVHLAANTGVAPSVADPRADCMTNVIGTLNCLEAARAAGVKRFVFASSGAPAGICTPPITEEIAPRPASPYGASKLAGEGYCSAYFNTFGLQTVALRFSNVYGPNSVRKGSVVAAFIKQAFAGQPLTIYGDGSQTRDFVFVGDLVESIRLSASIDGVGGELFQIATGVETSVRELLELLRPKMAAAGLPPIEVHYEPIRAGDVMRNYADFSKTRNMLDWTPKVELSAGLDRTVEWFKDHWSKVEVHRKR